MASRDQISTSSATGVTRRAFAAMGAGAAVLAAGAKASTGTLEVAERTVSLPIEAGGAAAKLYQPTTGEHPGLIMWAPAGQAARGVATRLSEQGWSVLVVNEEPVASEFGTPAFTKKARGLVAMLQQQPSVKRTSGKIAAGAADLGSGFMLRSVSAAAPRLSLASAAERRVAARTAYLFAMPSTEATKSPERLATLNEAARRMLNMAGAPIAA